MLSQQAVSVTGKASASVTACLELEEIQEADFDRSKYDICQLPAEAAY